MRITMTLPAAVVLSLAACSNPSSQDPVELQPGRYAVSISGVGNLLGGADSQSEEKSLCIVPDHASTFASAPLRSIIKLHDGCSDKIDERKGNAFGGSRRCSLAADGISIESTLSYTGVLKVDGFQIDGKSELKGTDAEGTNQNGGGKLTVRGQRTGDC
jgi:hypothetical protein